MRKFLIAFKQWLGTKLDQLDRNSYVVSMWNGQKWLVVRSNLKTRKQALAMRNIYALRMDIHATDIKIFTYKTATKYGMFA